MPNNRNIKISLFLKAAGLIFITLLAGCSSIRRDGPPLRPRDVSHIPDATPKNEPLSRYGNLPSYRVNGMTYHVRPTSLNYRVRGIASWYGTKFHSQRTSSGEIYDMYGMTAAHKTLPLPTYAQVTNLRNNKSVIVKINDRGPFATGRLIDLSYAAAKKLEITGHGTAWVEVAAIDPAHYRGKRSAFSVLGAPEKNKKIMFVQVGSFRNRVFAEKLKVRISHLVHVPVHIRQSSGSHNLYRVEVGPLQNAVIAAQIRHRLGMTGIDPPRIIQLPEV